MRSIKLNHKSKPQVLKTKSGEELAVLPMDIYKYLMEMAEELEDIRLYDEAKKDKHKGIELNAYLKKRKTKKNV